jgi:hypothetical protein
MFRSQLLLTSYLIAVITVLAPSIAWSRSKCPVLSVHGPMTALSVGEPMRFRVDVAPIDSALGYDWQVEGAELTAGQGTNSITAIGITGGVNVTATVTVHGLPDTCEASAAAVGAYYPVLEWEALDEWNELPHNDERARLDGLLSTLERNGDGNWRAYFVVHVSKRERLSRTQARLRRMVEHVIWRDKNFDLARLIFRVFRDEDRYRVWLTTLPPSLDPPSCDKPCTMYRGFQLLRNK